MVKVRNVQTNLNLMDVSEEDARVDEFSLVEIAVTCSNKRIFNVSKWNLFIMWTDVHNKELEFI